MSTTELIAELEWLFEFNVDPELAAQQLHRDPASLRRLLERHGRADLVSHFHASGWRAAA